MNTSVGERYEPYHKSRNGELTTLLTYEHNNAMYTVILEHSNDPAVYNLVYLNSHNLTRSVVGKITDLPTYKPDYTGMQIMENQRDNSLKTGIHKIIKSPCSGYVIIQMSQSHLIHCYSLSPVFEPEFEVFAFKLYEYTPVNTPINTQFAGIAWFANHGPSIWDVSYYFTPSGNFLYCMYNSTLHKLETSSHREVYKGQFGQFGDTNFKQLIPLDDTMICCQYMKNYNRTTGDNNPTWVDATEQKLFFKLGRVSVSGIEWLDTLEVLADDPWMLHASYGQLFSYDTNINCILDRNTLYFTYESRISWSVMALPINLLTNKFGQGYIVYQHPAIDRDILCPVLKFVHMDKLYGVVMNNTNILIVNIRLSDSKSDNLQGLEVLAAGRYFNLPHKEKWDHSQPMCKISFIDEPIATNKLDSLFKKNALQEPAQDITPFMGNSGNGYTDEYMSRSQDAETDMRITGIEFTPDLSCVLVYYSDAVYMYKAKLTYKEVDELVTNMDTRLADMGIDMPFDILTDIACTVAVPSASLSVRDRHKVVGAAELEAKLAERMRALNDDPEIKIVKKSTNDFLKPISVRQEKLHTISNVKYSTNPDVNYGTDNNGIHFGTLE